MPMKGYRSRFQQFANELKELCDKYSVWLAVDDVPGYYDEARLLIYSRDDCETDNVIENFTVQELLEPLDADDHSTAVHYYLPCAFDDVEEYA